MRSIVVIGFVLLFLIPGLQAQHFIGLSKTEAKTLARSSGFFPDNMTTSQSFNYTKYVNSADTKTLIVFFSEQDISTHTKMICDYSEYDILIRKYDSEYKRIAKHKWEYTANKEVFTVEIDEVEWYFTVRVKKK
jgi:hypothetical protein